MTNKPFRQIMPRPFVTVSRNLARGDRVYCSVQVISVSAVVIAPQAMGRTGSSSYPCSLHPVCACLSGSPSSLIASNPGPYVTSVGATNGTSPEQAAYFSGGGFSNYFERPCYQSQAVDNFLATLGDQTYAGLFKWVPLVDISSSPR